MLGNVVLFLMTWCLLRFEGKGLAAMGLDQPRRRIAELGVGFCLYGAVQAIRCMAWGPIAGFRWVDSPAVGWPDLLATLERLTQGVVYEELLFRGYLLILAIRYLGTRRGVVLSAVAFGVYHWFSYGILGQIAPVRS